MKLIGIFSVCDSNLLGGCVSSRIRCGVPRNRVLELITGFLLVFYLLIVCISFNNAFESKVSYMENLVASDSIKPPSGAAGKCFFVSATGGKLEISVWDVWRQLFNRFNSRGKDASMCRVSWWYSFHWLPGGFSSEVDPRVGPWCDHRRCFRCLMEQSLKWNKRTQLGARFSNGFACIIISYYFRFTWSLLCRSEDQSKVRCNTRKNA